MNILLILWFRIEFCLIFLVYASFQELNTAKDRVSV
jgi:hypothetical protein